MSRFAYKNLRVNQWVSTRLFSGRITRIVQRKPNCKPCLILEISPDGTCVPVTASSLSDIENPYTYRQPGWENFASKNGDEI